MKTMKILKALSNDSDLLAARGGASSCGMNEVTGVGSVLYCIA